MKLDEEVGLERAAAREAVAPGPRGRKVPAPRLQAAWASSAAIRITL